MLVLLSKSTQTEDKLLFRLVSGLVFFGVPHQGMAIGSLIPMVGDGPNKPLIELLDSLNTHRLDELQHDFMAGNCCQEVFVFYETKVSPTAEQVRTLCSPRDVATKAKIRSKMTAHGK